MPTTKCTMLFELNTDDATRQPIRAAGWSESHYYDGDPGFLAMYDIMRSGVGGVKSILSFRSDLLPKTGRIVAVRIQRVEPNPPGPAQTLNINFPGNQSLSTDQPGVAVQINAPGIGTRNVSRVELRGIPDEMIDKGAWSPTQPYEAAMNAYILTLAPYRFRARDLSVTEYAIHDITAGGAVTTVPPVPFLAGANVQVLRTLNGASRKVGGFFQVLSAGPGATKFVLDQWNLGATTGGKVRISGIVYIPYNTAIARVKQATTRKVGRPFDLYRGRRSAPH